MHKGYTPKWCTYVAHINEIGVWHDDFHLTNIWGTHISSTKKKHKGHAWNTTHNKPCVWIIVYIKVNASWRPILKEDGTLPWQDQT